MDCYADETAIEADGVIDEVLQLLTSTDPEDRIEAAGVMCEWVNSAYGDVGSALGAAMRQKGGVPVLAKLWSDHELLVKQRSLLILGNLCSDSVDAESGETKEILLQCRAEHALLACANSDDPTVLLLACAALQNLCQDVGWAHAVMECGFLPRLEVLVRHEDTNVVRYVAGALQNLVARLRTTSKHWEQLSYLTELSRRVILARMHQAAVEAFAEKRALRLIRSAARRIPPHLGFLRVQRWRNAERARLEAEAEVRQMWEAAAAIALQVSEG